MKTTRKHTARVSEALRKIIDDRGVSRYEISKQCGVDQGTLSRFMAGKQSLTLEAVDRMADFLGLVLATERRKRRSKGR